MCFKKAKAFFTRPAISVLAGHLKNAFFDYIQSGEELQGESSCESAKIYRLNL